MTMETVQFLASLTVHTVEAVLMGEAMASDIGLAIMVDARP